MSNMTQTPDTIHEDCGYPIAAHADFGLAGKCVIDLPDAHSCSRCGGNDNPRPLPKRFACSTCGDRPLCYACDVSHNLWCESRAFARFTVPTPPAVVNAPTPGCVCCGLLAARGAELPCGDCRAL
jgi:hypothetical protein